MASGGITLRPAPLWKRTLALAGDAAFVYLLLARADYVFTDAFVEAWVAPVAPRAVDPGLVVLLGIPFAYFTLAEWLLGYTVGKIVLRLGVRRTDGSRVGLLSSAVRNAVRFVDVLVVGALVVLARGDRRRLGDLVAGTIVVEEP